MIGIGIGVPFSFSSPIDADAAAFFARVIAAGGTLSATERTAVDKLVKDMKAANIWTAMKAVYPMVGASAAACAQNLKSSSFTGTFNGGWTFASTGVTGNATNAYMNTFFVPSIDNISANDGHLSFYSGTTGITPAAKVSIGCLDGAKETDLLIRWSDGKFYPNINENTYLNSILNSDSHGFYLASRNTVNNIKGYKNASLVSDGVSIPTVRPAISLFLGARNSNGGATSYDNKECRFSSIGDGLTTVNAASFYTAVQAFQTTLSRQV